ncbi:hypothetical protein N8766_00480 [bacterium]|nr:hypothetical protein [bacterium]MDA7645179.1 hypothetical protein [bacterium]
MKHLAPRFLPGDENIVFSVSRGDPTADEPDSGSIEIVNVRSRERHIVKENIRFGVYVPSGHIFYTQGEAAYTQKMNRSSLKLEEAPAPIKDYENVISISQDGTLVYRPASLEPEPNTLHWISSQGESSSATSHSGRFTDLSLSPNGKSVAIEIGGDIHVIDMEANTLRQLTYSSHRELSPSWLPDSKHVVFLSRRGNQQGFWQKPIDFSSQASPIIEHRSGLLFAHISGDDRLVLSVSHPESGVDIYVADFNNVSEMTPWLATKNTEQNGRASPKGGHWIAYDSNIGSTRDVFVRSFSNPEMVQKISTKGGGLHPKWSADGKSLYYESGKAIFSVSIEANEKVLTAGIPEKAIDLPSNAVTYGWDIAPDGKFLVMIEGEEPIVDGNPEDKRTKINLKFNWFTELIKATRGQSD